MTIENCAIFYQLISNNVRTGRDLIYVARYLKLIVSHFLVRKLDDNVKISLKVYEISNIMAALDEQASKNAFQDILRVWIYPEIDKRLKNGRLTKDFILTKAQVLLSPDKRNSEVRLNEEVKARITATFKGKHKEPGELVFESKLGDQISDIELTDNDDPNSAHVTMLLFKGRWVFHFDFRYNNMVIIP